MSAPVPDIATNRKARRDYQIDATYEAGVVLVGTEVKSIRAGKMTINDAFARVEKDQVWLFNCHIQPYEKASHTQHDATRQRRLLLHRGEINKLIGLTQQKGLSLPVLRAYWQGQRVKFEIGVGRGKDQGDKREDVKKREENREAQRAARSFNEKHAK
jgi:SsrA-binding protein